MPARLAAIDLDGTLLRTDKTLSARSLDALLAVQDAGIVVAVEIGRASCRERV